MSSTAYETLPLGDFKTQSGETIPDAHIAYKTVGDASLPAIIYPTWYSGLIESNLWLIGREKALNPEKYFIIVPALFGNGESSSPTNNERARPFPKCSLYDNVLAQHTLVTQHLGVKHARMVIGWSMGAQQTYQWATQYPDFMDLIVPFCGSAKTSLHNQVFLEGAKSALLSAKGSRSAGSGEDGVLAKGETFRTWSDSEKDIGLRAFGRVYAGWGFSQTFYRQKVFESVFDFKGLEDFMTNFWETWAKSKDPENLLVMLRTWQNGDCSNQEPYNGDFELAMQSIMAKALVLPSQTDLYFPPEDSEYEVASMKPGTGRMEAFPSIWGHWAGGPGDSKDDVVWLDARLKAFLDDPEQMISTGSLSRLKDLKI